MAIYSIYSLISAMSSDQYPSLIPMHFHNAVGPKSAVAAESAHAEHVEIGHAIFRIWML